MPDLSIKYNNEVIGELDNSGTATLKTTGKKCVSDIEVEYTKPAGGTVGNVFTVINNTADEFYLEPESSAFNENYGVFRYIPSGTTNATILARFENDKYWVTIDLFSNAASDIYDISVNNITVPFNNFGQAYVYESPRSSTPINGQTFAVVINNKQGN